VVVGPITGDARVEHGLGRLSGRKKALCRGAAGHRTPCGMRPAILQGDSQLANIHSAAASLEGGHVDRKERLTGERRLQRP